MFSFLHHNTFLAGTNIVVLPAYLLVSHYPLAHQYSYVKQQQQQQQLEYFQMTTQFAQLQSVPQRLEPLAVRHV